MIRKIVTTAVFFSVLFCVGLNASVDDGSCPLKLIPTPQKIEMLNGCFKIKSGVPIVLANPQDCNDRFAAEQLIEEVEKELDIKLEITTPKYFLFFRKPEILIGRIDRDRKALDATGRLKIDLGLELKRDGYTLDITGKRILIAGNDSAGVFYGVQTLKQIIRANRDKNTIPCCRIVDWPGLIYRAWLDDVTRGPIPKLEMLKRKIRTMAEYKQNMVTLYTEHVFKLKKHPKLAPPDGYAADEIRELVDYSRKHHVEMVGNFQSFAHFWNILKHPEYAHLQETMDVLTPAKEESYEFLKDVYSEVVPAYEKGSKYFHVCGDEVYALGRGPAKKMVQEMGYGGAYTYHINRINELIKPYGKSLMIWCDTMTHHSQFIPRLPEDIIIIPWTYSTYKIDSYDKRLKPVSDKGRQLMGCCGIMNWQLVWPNFDDAIKNITMWVRECVKYNALGVFNTSWMDSGENFYNYNWYPFMWGAECTWKPVPEQENRNYDDVTSERVKIFNEAFGPLFYGEPNLVTNAIIKLSGLKKYPFTVDVGDYRRLSKRIFWKDLLSNLDYTIDADADIGPQNMLTETEEVIAALMQAKTQRLYNIDTIDYALFAARRARFIAKNRSLYNAIVYFKKDNKGSLKQIQKDLMWLSDEMKSMRAEYIRLWDEEYRKSWLDTVLARFDQSIRNFENRDIQVVMPKVNIFNDKLLVRLETFLGPGEIYYTLNGSEPAKSSKKYTGPITLDKTTTIRARAYCGKRASYVSARIFTKLGPDENTAYSYYESACEGLWGQLPNFDLLTPVKSGKCDGFDTSLRERGDFYCFDFSGFVDVAADGEYTFYLKSDDGSKLYIDGKMLIYNDGLHGANEKSGKVLLKAGRHVITVPYFEGMGYEALVVSYEGVGIKKQAILSHK